jgi:hypothetical protein
MTIASLMPGHDSEAQVASQSLTLSQLASSLSRLFVSALENMQCFWRAIQYQSKQSFSNGKGTNMPVCVVFRSIAKGPSARACVDVSAICQ